MTMVAKTKRAGLPHHTPVNLSKPGDALTKTQQRVLDLIVRYIREIGYPPSILDLMGKLGIRSPNGIVCHLMALEKKGRIRRDRGVTRGIVVLQGHGEHVGK